MSDDTKNLNDKVKQSLANKGEQEVMSAKQALAGLPKLGGMVDAVQGKVPLSAVIPSSMKDTTTPKELMFDAQTGEQIQAYIKDCVDSLSMVLVVTAFPEQISRLPEGEPLQAIEQLGRNVKDLMDLVDPTETEESLSESPE